MAQKGETLFGFKYKPIIPNRLIGMYDQEFNKGIFQSTVTQKVGHSFGGIIRVGLGDVFALETGITYTQRNFKLDYAVPDSGYVGEGNVRVVSYEMPISCLVFIRLSDEIYMNTALGAALTLFPSDVRTYEPIDANERFQQEGAYRSKFQASMLANLGFEYRTKEKGTFYLGSSYHLPFAPIMTFAMSYEFDQNKIAAIDNIRGSYLTVDLRYYFPMAKEK
ncbi:MAG: hypothetical protein ABJG68_15455 [Crocinitomicaceae bacterium]